jgi:hypothetical protein
MDTECLIAIDVHTHAEVSCRQPQDEAWIPYEEAANKYFKVGRRPTVEETIAYYRERKISLVMFAVDSEFQIGAHRIPNEEVAASIPFPKRFGTPAEFADLVLTCVRNLSLNGEVIRLDGALRLAPR